MANWQQAKPKTLKVEGGWNLVPGDEGGETYQGVARNYWPKWEGWAYIDTKYKGCQGFPASVASAMEADPLLAAMVNRFYKSVFWDSMLLDQCESQAVAEELFDSGVNCWVVKPVMWLQEALVMLNTDPEVKDIDVDGGMGNQTMTTLNQALRTAGNESRILKSLNCAQGEHYKHLAIKNRTQRQFVHGWFDWRVHLGPPPSG